MQPGTKWIVTYTTRYQINWYVYHKVHNELVCIQSGTQLIGMHTTRSKINCYAYSQVYNELFI